MPLLRDLKNAEDRGEGGLLKDGDDIDEERDENWQKTSNKPENDGKELGNNSTGD